MGLPGPPGEKGTTVRHSEQRRPLEGFELKSSLILYGDVFWMPLDDRKIGIFN